MNNELCSSSLTLPFTVQPRQGFVLLHHHLLRLFLLFTKLSHLGNVVLPIVQREVQIGNKGGRRRGRRGKSCPSSVVREGLHRGGRGGGRRGREVKGHQVLEKLPVPVPEVPS